MSLTVTGKLFYHRVNIYGYASVRNFLYFDLFTSFYFDPFTILQFCTIISLTVGIPANIFILVVIIYNWKTRSAFTWLILNLSVADFFLELVYNIFFVII